MKVEVGEVFEEQKALDTANDAQDSFIDEYLKSIAREKRVPGDPIPGRKEAFEEMLVAAQKYQELNGGRLEGETDDYEGFLVYRTDSSIVHYPGDEQMCEFWGKVLSNKHLDYAISPANGRLEIFAHELFITLRVEETK